MKGGNVVDVCVMFHGCEFIHVRCVCCAVPLQAELEATQLTTLRESHDRQMRELVLKHRIEVDGLTSERNTQKQELAQALADIATLQAKQEVRVHRVGC